MKKTAELISTFFYVGKIKYCPGTCGSLAVYPLCYFLSFFLIKFDVLLSFPDLSFYENMTLNIFFALIVLSLFLFLVGIYFSSIHAKSLKESDPSEIVIDEAAGQALTIGFCWFARILWVDSNLFLKMGSGICDFLFLFLSPFILFRLFDIFKPWPINWLDRNVKGGLGIMLDDIAAAFFASVCHYAMIFVILDFT